jgi:hypothetical protein
MAEPKITSETAQAIAAGMPPCPLCNGRNVRPSLSMTLEDRLRAMFHYTPYRCRGCQHRFYYRPPKAGAADKAKAAKAG